MRSELKGANRGAPKRARVLTKSNIKRKKITTPAQEENNEAKEDDTNRQTTLSQYQNTAPVMEPLRGLRNRNNQVS